MSVPAAFIAVIMIWSTTPLAIKWSAEGPGYLFGLSARMVVGVAICLLLIMALRIRLPWHRHAIATYLVAGVGLYLAMMSVYWGAQFVPSGLVSVIFGLTPVVTGVFAALWLGEAALTPGKVGAMVAGLAGLALIFAGGHGPRPHDAAYGVMAIGFSVVVHSLSTVWVKRLGHTLPAMVTTTGALLVALPAYLITWWWFDGAAPEALPERALYAILYLGVFGSALGFVLYYYMLSQVEASRIALIPLITPVTALWLGHWLNHESLSAQAWFGTALVLSALIFYQWGARRGPEPIPPEPQVLPTRRD